MPARPTPLSALSTQADTPVVIPYAPRPSQRTIHDACSLARWIVAVCHRRMGKTVAAVNELQRQALTCTRPRPRYAYLAPTYRQGKAIAWDYMQHYAAPIPGVKMHQQELRVDFPNGGQVRIFGADDPNALRGLYFDGVVCDEYGFMQPSVFSEVLRPALSDRQGWAMFLGTPNGHNQFYEAAERARLEEAAGNPAWRYIEFRASQTGILPPEELAAARETMTEDEYAQEYECSWAASVIGSIFGKLIEQARDDGRVTRVPVDPTIPVDTDWDLGMDDATAIWFSQRLRSGEVRLVDYYENSGEGLPHYASVLTRKGYTYGEHWGPHDIEVRELGSGRSRKETAAALGIKFLVTPRLSPEDGIHAARMLLPRCYFDSVRCTDGLKALAHYRRQYHADRKVFHKQPVHDWASHGADAFRGLAVRHRPPKPRRQSRDVYPAGRGASPDTGAWMH